MYSDYSEDSDTRIDYYDISKQKTETETIKKIIEKRQNYYSNIRIPDYRDKKYTYLFRGIKFNNNFFLMMTDDN